MKNSTITQTITDITVTSQVVATVTPTVPKPQKAQIYLNGNQQAAYLGTYVSGGLVYAAVVTDPSAAMDVTLGLDGHLWYGDKVAKGDGSGALVLQLFFINPTDSTARVPYNCSKDANEYLKCYTNDPNADLVFGWRSNNFVYVGTRANIQTAGYPIIDLKLL
ncbi:hypothetical protein ABW19_dt0207969 [Dactylella cylindrospora]|nr:hypothetical protein ABW19_dt0207969 [Dactylella cylindrospora]